MARYFVGTAKKFQWIYEQNQNAVTAAPQCECNRNRFSNYRLIYGENCIVGYHFHHIASISRILGRDLFLHAVSLKNNYHGWQVWPMCQPSHFWQVPPAFTRCVPIKKPIIMVGRSGKCANHPTFGGSVPLFTRCVLLKKIQSWRVCIWHNCHRIHSLAVYLTTHNELSYWLDLPVLNGQPSVYFVDQGDVRLWMSKVNVIQGI